MSTSQFDVLGTQHRTLESMVSDELRTSIVTGELEPGERLVESVLAERMGVSRAPVRTAIRELVREGFVELVPRKGAMVAEVSPESALDCYDVRIALEGLAARLAAERATEEDVDLMGQMLTAGSAAVAAGEWMSLATLNNSFHAALAQAARNQELLALMHQYELRIAWIFSRAAKSRGEPAWEEHTRIVEAVAAHDADSAELLARQHIENSRAVFIEKMGQPNAFVSTAS